ncbi:unnamed protein product [Orchesella dallaii]|uniref:Peptidase S1 domain-containing protein n=1 Tax=Orchesella dallaii TaxID=48710 RepID=A0ABP1RDH6_9HEXA
MSPLKLFIFVTACSVASVSGQGCQRVNGYNQPGTCPPGTYEIYHDHFPSTDYYSVACCQPGTPDETSWKLYTTECKSTGCLAGVGQDENDGTKPCESLKTRRYVNGKELEFEETIRDEGCEQNGMKGSIALCCVKDSLDTLQATLYGVEHKEFPHFAKIGKAGCGATIYNERYVLTASHCVTDANTYKVDESMAPYVRFNIEIEDAYTVNKYTVVEVIVHEDSSRLAPLDEYGSLFNDVALLKLDRDIVFGDNVKAMPLAPAGFDPRKYADKAVIVGFGMTNTGRQNKVIQKANVLLRDNAKVLDREGHLANMQKYSDQLIFVGGIMGDSVSPAAGTGDSGGPAICRDANGYAVLCGITSFSFPMQMCEDSLGDICFPSGYARPDYFRDWIVKHAGDQSKAVLLKQPLFGLPVAKNKYPHQVHITSDDGSSCGGTLIENDVVVTAAQCIANGDGTGKSGVKIKGTQDLKSTSGKTVEVKDATILEGFSKTWKRSKRVVSLVYETNKAKKPNAPVVMKDPYFTNDLALIKLESSLGISKVAKVASSADVAKGMATELSFPRNTTRSGKLTQREFKLLKKNECQRRVDKLSGAGYHIQLDENVICGVEWYSGGSMCDRELGGGLMCKDSNGEEVLCGIQVFRLCEYNAPNLFLNAGEYSDWIKSNAARL